ncbi:MAG: class I SAM-dependent methyltransferase [Acidobacteriota bacterium]
MSLPTPAVVAFDRLAPDYDALASGETFSHQRRLSHAAFAAWVPAGSRVLEIGCGSGLDTEYFARAGLRVTACDPSPEMVARTLRRLAAVPGSARSDVVACGLEHLPDLLPALAGDEGFDVLVSNFGALNCVECLAPLGRLAASHLRPGGAVLIGLMGRWCAWEVMYFSATGRRGLARRRRTTPALVPVAGVEVPTFYHRVADVGRALGPGLHLRAVRGLGIVVPPPYLEPRWRQVPVPLRRAAVGLDRLVSPLPGLNRLGDHVLTRWVKRRSADA